MGLGFSEATAASAAWNPILECVPSQKGLFTLAPHRQSENAVFPTRLYALPFASINSILPSGHSTRYGPLGRIVIFTTAILFPLSNLCINTTRMAAMCQACHCAKKRPGGRDFKLASGLTERYIYRKALALNIHHIAEGPLIPPREVQADEGIPYP